MEDNLNVLEYKCPCCNAGLIFGEDTQKFKCEYCDNTFDIDTIKEYQASQSEIHSDYFSWDDNNAVQSDLAEDTTMRGFICPSCAGEIVTDENTAATFCPFCDNPTIMPSRLSGNLRPDAVLPFKTSKEDAKNAFLNLCKGKPLLPKGFTSEQRLERITGIYVPFWLYSCEADFQGTYKATRVHRWSDSQYHYTKTDHFLLRRNADADFSGIPMDASSKMDDAFMESIEPFDYNELKDFDTAYLSGYFADKYDVPSDQGEPRIRQRVEDTIREELQKTMLGYATVLPANRTLQIEHSKAQYVLLPVWILNTRYKDKLYTFAMNGQTGKMTGSFPVCSRKTAAFFSGIFLTVTALVTLIQLLF